MNKKLTTYVEFNVFILFYFETFSNSFHVGRISFIAKIQKLTKFQNLKFIVNLASWILNGIRPDILAYLLELSLVE
jgi:hypothetical protein